MGLFLNISKGYDSNDKPILKLSYVLSWLSLFLVFANAYVFYHIVDKYTKDYRTIDVSLLLEEPQKNIINKVESREIKNKKVLD